MAGGAGPERTTGTAGLCSGFAPSGKGHRPHGRGAHPPRERWPRRGGGPWTSARPPGWSALPGPRHAASRRPSCRRLTPPPPGLAGERPTMPGGDKTRIPSATASCVVWSPRRAEPARRAARRMGPPVCTPSRVHGLVGQRHVHSPLSTRATLGNVPPRCERSMKERPSIGGSLVTILRERRHRGGLPPKHTEFAQQSVLARRATCVPGPMANGHAVSPVERKRTRSSTAPVALTGIHAGRGGCTLPSSRLCGPLLSNGKARAVQPHGCLPIEKLLMLPALPPWPPLERRAPRLTSLTAGGAGTAPPRPPRGEGQSSPTPTPMAGWFRPLPEERQSPSPQRWAPAPPSPWPWPWAPV